MKRPGIVAATRYVAATCVVLVATLVVGAVPAARDAKAPTIVAAAMQDLDRDARADRVRLTYSEAVRHKLDSDGRFPFSVAGYRFRSVGRANGKSLVVQLVERSAADSEVRPVVRYRRTSIQPVLDRGGNQAVGQTFRRTRAHGNASTPTPTPQPQPQPQPTPQPTVTDRDGDGVVDGQDCAPSNPAISPKATDLPDLGFVDSNCDGIDGTEKDAIFVSPTGKDENPGTKAAPKRQILAALAAATPVGKDVYAATGTYGKVTVTTRVGIYGGYSTDGWKRSLTAVSTIAGVEDGLVASGVTQVTLQLLTVEGQSGSFTGASTYGIRAINSKLTLQRVTVRAGDGTAGSSGTTGSTGLPGKPGGNGYNGRCDFEGNGSGGSPGAGPGGAYGAAHGGFGGKGGHSNRDGYRGTEGVGGTPGGEGGVSGSPGRKGEDGKSGAYGMEGTRGNGGSSAPRAAAHEWRGENGTSGDRGAPGKGGGGGGGGGGQHGAFVKDGTGNGGGGGGGGGGAGGGGGGGGAGGGSFGIYLYASSLTATSGSSVQAGNGREGGQGGQGGSPGAGGARGLGGTFCNAEVGTGGNGGQGGRGGVGGGGGGGAGGPSIGVMKVGGSTATLGDTSVKVGRAGPRGEPGRYGTGGAPAQPGIAVDIYPASG